MRCTPAILIGILCLIAEIVPSRAFAEAPPGVQTSWSFRDGDRVALIGGTFIEREQRYGYLETALTIANPDKTILFRNLGWSGDTVGGVSRSGFDPPEAGFKQLIDRVNGFYPTVIIVGYGANEAFNSKAGLDAFSKGLERLIDALKPTKARLILLAPLKQEDMGRPLPDPSKHNTDIALYSRAIEEIAKRAGAGFVALDPFSNPGPSSESVRLTDNGIHLTALGYWKLANGLEAKNADRMTFSMKVTKPGNPPPVPVECTLEWPAFSFMGTVSGVTTKPREVRFTRLDRRLPSSPQPADSSSSAQAEGSTLGLMRVKGLEPGKYSLRVDGKPLATGSETEWVKGISLDGGPELDQVERLRETIVKKNELFFHRWRPQNITYLLGFRKHEQGNNAVELPKFDPLVAEQEQKIGVMKKPVAHVYELVREDAKGGAR